MILHFFSDKQRCLKNTKIVNEDICYTIYLNIQIWLNNNVVLLGWSEKQRCQKNNAINKNIYLKIQLINLLGAVQVSRFHFGVEGV